MKMRPIATLVLDVEGTLVSNAVSQFPRPGLRTFLESCGGAVTIGAGESEASWSELLGQLVDRGCTACFS